MEAKLRGGADWRQWKPKTLDLHTACECRWREQVEAKLRDVADWRLWHNNTDTPLLEVDARDVRQKWARPGYVPPMHPHWHRPADMRAEVASHCWGGTHGIMFVVLVQEGASSGRR